MAFKVTINGVDKTDKVHKDSPPRVSKRQNERSTGYICWVPGYFPDQFDEILMYDIDGTTEVFGGLVLVPSTRGIEQASFLHFTDTDLVDFMIYTDWAFFTKSYTSPVTLKTVLTDAIADTSLSTNGVALDALQDDGPTFDPFDVDMRVSDFLRELGTRCSPPRVVKMSPLKKLRMLVPGTISAPFNITDVNPHCLSVEWAGSNFTPANLITVIAGPTGEGTPTQTWTADGVATSFEVDVPASVGSPVLGVVTEDGTMFQTVSLPGGGGYYYWDDTVGRGTISVGTGATPGAGVVLTYRYTAIYPFKVTATSGGSPVIEYRATAPDISLRAPAQELADGLLARFNQSPKDVNILTLEPGLDPAQGMTITLSSRSLSALPVTVADVDSEFTEYEDGSGDRLWVTRARLTGTTEYQGSYLDQARAMFGTSGGATAVSGGGSSPSTSIPGPISMGGVDTARIPMAATPAYSLLLNWLPLTPDSDITVEVTAWLWSQNGVVQGKAEIAEFVAPATFTQVNESGWTAASTRIAGQTSFLAVLEAGKTYVARAKSDTASTGIYAMVQVKQV